jgi:hypothetical protein
MYKATAHTLLQDMQIKIHKQMNSVIALQN